MVLALAQGMAWLVFVTFIHINECGVKGVDFSY